MIKWVSLFPRVEGLKLDRNLRDSFLHSDCDLYLNQLLEEAIDVDTITSLKGHLGKYMDRKVLDGYGANASKWYQPSMLTWVTWTSQISKL